MREYCDKLKAIYNYNFSLLATSGEFISGRFINYDKKVYNPPVDVFSKGYYTNSFHVDVNSNLPGYEKIRKEGNFHHICNGGCITYLELGEAPLDNIEALLEYIELSITSGIHY